MSGNEKGSTPFPPNAFDPDFLHLLGERDEPVTAGEADIAASWMVGEVRGRGFGLFPAGESPQRGHKPAAVFTSPFLALLAAAVLPGVGRDAEFRLQSKPDQEGYALQSRGEWGGVVAHFELFDDKLVNALNVVHSLAVSPWCLAYLLEAVGGIALDRAGAILAERVAAAKKE